MLKDITGCKQGASRMQQQACGSRCRPLASPKANAPKVGLLAVQAH